MVDHFWAFLVRCCDESTSACKLGDGEKYYCNLMTQPARLKKQITEKEEEEAGSEGGEVREKGIGSRKRKRKVTLLVLPFVKQTDVVGL